MESSEPAPAAEKEVIPQQSQTNALRPESVKSQPTGEDASTVRPPSSTTNVSLRTKHIEANHKPDQEAREIRTSSEGSHDGHDLEKGDATGEQVVAAPVDPNIVDFDGPNDPEMAINWTKKQKWSTVGILSLLTFITPLASSMFAPGVPEVLADFKSDDSLLGSFVVSVYILGYAIGPMFIAPLSEMYGRRWLYHCTNVLFVIFTIACAVSSNLNILIAFRFFAGCAGSAVLTMGGGTIADLFKQEERGTAISLWALGPLLGPVVGPVAGGFLSQAKGWRMVFWVITACAGAITIACFLILRETYSIAILERKTKRLRKETGNQALRSKLDSGLTPADFFKKSIIRPSKMLLYSPIVLILSMQMAVVYGYLYLLFTTITEVFEGQYGFSQGTVGLTYLGLGVGMFFGLICFGLASDWLLKRMSAKGEMKPEYRLPPMIPGAMLIPIGLFLYGWTADKHVFWFVPILGSSLVGLGLLATFMPVQTYLVDAFTIKAASAIAANTVLRSLVGALLPLAGPSMYAKLGLGWGNSLLGFIAVAMVPIPFFFYKYGERIRTNPRFQVDF